MQVTSFPSSDREDPHRFSKSDQERSSSRKGESTPVYIEGNILGTDGMTDHGIVGTLLTETRHLKKGKEVGNPNLTRTWEETKKRFYTPGLKVRESGDVDKRSEK